MRYLAISFVSTYFTMIYFSIHECTYGRHPNSSLAMYTMPQRDIVYGLACSKSVTSKSMRMYFVRWILSPLGRVRTRLSSRAVLRFSTQDESMGPSKTVQNYCLSFLSLLWNSMLVSEVPLKGRLGSRKGFLSANLRIIFEASPSLQFFLSFSCWPNSSSLVSIFGLITFM